MGKLLRSVETNLTFDFRVFCFKRHSNDFEVAAWERMKGIKPNFALRETREEDELSPLSSFLRER